MANSINEENINVAYEEMEVGCNPIVAENQGMAWDNVGNKLVVSTIITNF